MPPPMGMFPGGIMPPPMGMYPRGMMPPPMGMYPGGMIRPPNYPQYELSQISYFNDVGGKNTNIKDKSKKSFSTETVVSLYKFLTDKNQDF